MFATASRKTLAVLRLLLILVAKMLVTFYHWMFNAEDVSVTEQDDQGFHLHQYYAVPDARPHVFRVSYRHTLNGQIVASWSIKLYANEWQYVRSRLTEAGDLTVIDHVSA